MLGTKWHSDHLLSVSECMHPAVSCKPEPGCRLCVPESHISSLGPLHGVAGGDGEAADGRCQLGPCAGAATTRSWGGVLIGHCAMSLLSSFFWFLLAPISSSWGYLQLCLLWWSTKVFKLRLGMGAYPWICECLWPLKDQPCEHLSETQQPFWEKTETGQWTPRWW